MNFVLSATEWVTRTLDHVNIFGSENISKNDVNAADSLRGNAKGRILDDVDAVADGDVQFFESGLDRRWTYDGGSGSFFFNPSYSLINENRNGPINQDLSQRTPSSVISNPNTFIHLSDLICALQELNQEFQIYSDDLDSMKLSVGFSGYSNTSKRRIRRLKFQLNLLRKKNKRLYSMIFPGQSMGMYNVNDEEEDGNGDKDEQGDSDDQSGKRGEMLHFLRHLDEIQHQYFEAVETAKEFEEEERLIHYMLQPSQLNQESQLLEQLTHQYFYGPLDREDFMRNLNQLVFQDYEESDPLLMQLEKTYDTIFKKNRKDKKELSNVIDMLTNDHDDGSFQSSTQHNIRSFGSKYAKINILRRRTQKEREKRRQLLLSSSTFSQTDAKDQLDFLKKAIETERISSLLHYLSSQNKQTQISND